MFLDFFYALRSEGMAIGADQVLEFYSAPDRLTIANLDDLFVLLRLICVKRRSDLDIFERTFLNYFYALNIPAMAEGDIALLETKQFKDWLRQARQAGEIPLRSYDLDIEALMRKFWDTVREQMKEHHGGSRWVGTGGTSPFGHSGNATNGIRVYGQAGNFSALKVIGERRHIAYSSRQSLTGENLRQALALLKNMQPHHVLEELDIEESVYASGKTGDIELVFRAPLRNKLKVILFIDNGGHSMLQHVPLTRLLFEKMSSQLKSLKTYFFHNTIYGYVFKDDTRTEAHALSEILKEDSESRIFIIGDGSMAPSELFSRYGNINYGEEEYEPSIERLRVIRNRFRHSVWLNPIAEREWNVPYAASTITAIARIFPMFDITLEGIRRAVEKING